MSGELERRWEEEEGEPRTTLFSGGGRGDCPLSIPDTEEFIRTRGYVPINCMLPKH